MKKLISIVTPCFNEEDNVEICAATVCDLFTKELPGYDFEHIFCDNASTDGTAALLLQMALRDRRIKVILNARNFGPFASLFNGVLATRGDATLCFLAADLQDPPELIPEFVREWENGTEVCYGIRVQREENPLMVAVRRAYYGLVSRWSNLNVKPNVGEFQLVDRKVVTALRQFDDYYPYVRGMIAACGFRSKGFEHTWRRRVRGKSKTSLLLLIDQGLNGLISVSRVPVRLILLVGLVSAVLSGLFSVVTVVYGLIFFRQFAPPGIPLLTAGLFFFSGVQLFFLGVIGEYVAAIHAQVRRRPLVVERSRTNFDLPAGSG